MGSKIFKPGERVTATAIYRIEHDSHRLMHHAVLREGTLFPRCRTCGDSVRFSLLRYVRTPVIPFRSTDILEEVIKPQRAGGS
ncbi:MAG TPA: hypothetical protein VFI72_02375 [Candidatus Angelobacter sp.]|nr:hypothetical protein [Candidatus Angelobacter sp.]